MESQEITLKVPAEPTYARSVRMMAANLAVLCSMNVDEVEDARMAAEEAFIYACATGPAAIEMGFTVQEGALEMSFALGDEAPEAGSALAEQVSLAELLLSAVSDFYEIRSTSIFVRKLSGSAYAD